MVYKCCVYGCKSNYEVRTKEFKSKNIKLPHIPVFTFPKNDDLREEWIRKIPNQDLKVTKNSRVCIKHFHVDDVITEEVFPGKDGQRDVIVSMLYKYVHVYYYLYNNLVQIDTK